MTPGGAPRVLFVSNGHGEDAIACRLVDRVRSAAPELSLAAWPMVGRGEAYRARSLPIVGAANLLPSDGFATLDLRLLMRDLRAGWVGTHLRQLSAARRLRGAHGLIVAVGDVVPIAAAVLARTPFLFVGCAKSSYYGKGWGYTALELRWLRGRCALAFPRDALTARELADAGVRVRFVGNPMMDDLEGSGGDFGLAPGVAAIVLLPGSRDDAPANAARLLSLVPDASTLGRSTTYLMPVAEGFELRTLVPPPEWTAHPVSPANRRRGIVAVLARADTMALVVRGGASFADALRRASLAIGMAGTANEQAIGLGLPLLVLPAVGGQGARFVRMKMRYFGAAAVRAPEEPAALAERVRALLDDRDLRERMASAGRERMGNPGASAAIAAEIVARARAAATAHAAVPDASPLLSAGGLT